MNKTLLLTIIVTLSFFSAQAQDSIHKEVNLNGVTVDGKTMNMHDDHTTYLPTKEQKNAANSGWGLLYNLMIPQIEVDKLNGTVKSRDNSKVAIYKDGMPTTADEIKTIRPKDVLRVEFYNNAKDKFPNEDKVVNIVMRKYESGGYASIQTETRFVNELGSYQGLVSLDHKKTNYTVMIGTDYKHDHAKGEEGEETYRFADEFTKYINPQSNLVRDNSYYGLLRVSHTTQKAKLKIETKLLKDKNTGNSYGITSYTNGKYPESTSASDNLDRNIALQVNPNFYIKFNDKHTLNGDFNFNYLHDTYDRDYTEGTSLAPVNNYAKENQYYGQGELTYSLTLNDKNGFTFFGFGSYEKSSIDYGKTTVSHQTLDNIDLLMFLNYWHKFSDKLFAQAQMGFDFNSYSVNSGKSVAKFWPRPALIINYNVNQFSNLSFDARLGNSVPVISYLSEATQRINHFEVKRGNPSLKNTTMSDVMLSYNINLSSISMSVFSSYTGYFDMFKENFALDGSDFVHTYFNDGDYHSLTSGMQATFNLFKNKLNLSVGGQYLYQKSTGIYSASNTQWVYGAQVAAYVKEFSFNGHFTPSFTYLNSMTSFTDNPVNYGISVSWNHKGWFIEVGGERFFEKHVRATGYYDYGIYKYNRTSFSDSFGKQFYVKLSYNFDFGRKKVEHENIEIGQGRSSAILKL